MKKIVILIPTRERLVDFKLFAESWKNTTEGHSDVIVRIDNDDLTYEEIKKEFPEFIYEYGERKPFLFLLNDIALKYCNDYEYMGFMEDDCTFNTYGWESIFINKLRNLGNNGIVWGNDLVNYDRLVGMPFMNSNIIKKLGYICPPDIKYLWADNFWKDIGTKLNSLYYFSDVIIEHRHYSKGKRKIDNISKIVDSYLAIDGYSYSTYINTKFNDDVRKLSTP